jgi:hypothetical protein
MAIEQTVVINTDTRSLAGLRQEIREIQTQLDLTPTGTKEYDDLVVRLRQAKGEIKDFKEATKGLDPDQRAAKLVNAFQGMTGAIQSAAGALTLFGGNSEDLEKVEKNLLGIIAIGGGIQSTIEGYNDAVDVIGPKLKGLGATISEAFTTGAASARAFNIALAGIGIGVAIVAVNELSKAFEDNKKAQEDAAKEADLSLKRVDNAERKKLAAIIDSNKKQLRSDLETARERGASDLELVQIKLDSQKALTKAFDEFRNESNTQTAAFIDEQNKLALASADAEIEIGNELNEVKRKQREKDAADAKALAKEKSDFLLGIENDLREALQQLAIDQAATERERAQIEYNNTLEDFRIAKNAELAEAERLGVSKANIIAKYDALEKGAKIKLNNDLAAIDKAASEKLIAERRQQLESQLSAVEAQYSRTLNNIENAASQIALTQNVATKEQFDDINVFIAEAINATQAALEQQNLDQATTIRNRVNITVKLLEEEQLKRQQILQQQTDDAIKNNGIFSKEAKDAQDKQAADFQAFQDRKLQIITNSSKELLTVEKSTTEKQAQYQQQLQDLVLGSAKSLFGDLTTLSQNYDDDNEAARKQAFEQQKLFAIASATVDTYLAAQKAFTSQIIPGDPTSIGRAQIAAAVAVAAGLGRIAVIAAQKFDSPSSAGGGGGGSFGSVGGTGGGGNTLNPFSGGGFGGGGTNVLPPRLAPKRDPNEFQADATGQFGGTGVTTPVFRTYVLAGDVTDAQVANEKINQKRKL